MARTTARAGDMEECTDVESNEHMQKETHFTYPPLTDVSQYTIASFHGVTATIF